MSPVIVYKDEEEKYGNYVDLVSVSAIFRFNPREDRDTQRGRKR